MRPSALIVLLLAVVFGSIAVFATNVWLQGQSQTVASVSAPEIRDTVVVAAVPLRFGDRLTRENLKEIPWTAGALPTGSFRDPTELLNSEDGDRQVITAIEANEPVLEWKITGPGQRASLSAVLESGKKAVSIRVNDVLGVAGFVLPGDRVDMFLSRKDGDNPVVDVLLQNIKVLAIDQLADNRSDDPTVVRTVTVEVDTADAQRLTLAASVGQLSLALRRTAADSPELTDRITLNDLNGTEPVAETPVVIAEPAAPEPIVRRPVNAQIGVIRGSSRENYNVPIAK